MCTLVSREILAHADPESGTFEVQRLQLRLPPLARAEGPTAHFKVRAPDAPGQRNRVRAYSFVAGDALPDVAGVPPFAAPASDSRSVYVTVKIYPGGPPRTSALGG